MSEMDSETSGQPFPAHPSMPRERCPYRPPTDAPGSFQFPGLLAQQANPNLPFHPTHTPPHTFWDNISQQNMPPHESMNNRFVQMSTSHPPGRAPEIASFAYQMGLDSHSPPSGPTRHSRFEGSRPLPQRTRSYHNGIHSSAEAQTVLALGTTQSGSSGAVDLGSTYNGGGMARRNGSAPTMPQENGSSNLQASPSRHLPPPTSSYHGLLPGQNTAYPQPRFSPDGIARNSTQSSTPLMPPHPPTLPRETSWARAEAGSRNSTHPNWFQEAFYTTQNADMDSDEELTEPQDETLRRQARLDPHTTLQLLHEQMRLAGGPRRMNPFDPDGPETSLERARAARRAAAAAVKFVASSAALASLEPVDLKTLTGDERSCIICYNEFGVKNPDGFIECPVRLPKCKHIFGDRCLKQWLQDSDSCPYCRDKLPSEPKRASQNDDVRRLIAQTRNYATDPWYAPEVSRLQTDTATGHAVATESEHQYRQLMQQRLGRHDEGSDDILARIRRREDYEWSTSFSQSSIGTPSRSMPDYDGRRRYRGRHSVSRSATQAAGRANGPNSNRLARNVSLQSGPMRAPAHSSTPSFDGNSASQRRSVTPHPTIAGIPTWSSPPQLQPTTSGRPSSLPTERSPLGEATEARPNPLGSRTASGSSTLSSPPLDTPWLENHNAANSALVGWRMPLTGNGRPASASFINDLPQSRLQQLHEDLDSLGVHIQNHRLPPYMTASNDADIDTHMGSVHRR